MMNRREILKFSLLAPIAGLFKKKNPTFIEPDIPPTTGTSSEGPSYYLLDPTSEWAKACAKEYNDHYRSILDDVIIKSLGQ